MTKLYLSALLFTSTLAHAQSDCEHKLTDLYATTGRWMQEQLGEPDLELELTVVGRKNTDQHSDAAVRVTYHHNGSPCDYLVFLHADRGGPLEAGQDYRVSLREDPFRVVVEYLQQINPTTRERSAQMAYRGYGFEVVMSFESIDRHGALIEWGAYFDVYVESDLRLKVVPKDPPPRPETKFAKVKRYVGDHVRAIRSGLR